MSMKKVPCPKCGQQVYEAEGVCPFCASSLAARTPVAAAKEPLRPPLPETPIPVIEVPGGDSREKILGLPLLTVFGVVGVLGLVMGFLLQSALKEIIAVNPSFSLAPGPLSVLMIAIATMARWLLNTLVLWFGIRVAAAISGDPFQGGFLKGYRTFLPVTMLMLVASDAGLFLMVATKVFFFAMIAWGVSLLILKHFLELEWFEVIALNVVLGLINMFTGGLV